MMHKQERLLGVNPDRPFPPPPPSCTIPTETLSTGAVRQKTAGRGCYELMSPFVLERDAKIYEWGAVKRGYRNWEKGMPFSRCIQSIFRHLTQFMTRQNDPDHGDCLAAIRFWCATLMHYEEMIKRGLLPKSLDDMPHYVLDPYMPGHGPVERIYVSGPISGKTQGQIDFNYKRGQSIGRMLEKRGHFVFTPHNHVVRTEGQLNVSPEVYESLMEFDLSVIKYWATALYFITSSPGADRERKLAEELGLKIFLDLPDVPDLNRDNK